MLDLIWQEIATSLKCCDNGLIHRPEFKLSGLYPTWSLENHWKIIEITFWRRHNHISIIWTTIKRLLNKMFLIRCDYLWNSYIVICNKTTSMCSVFEYLRQKLYRKRAVFLLIWGDSSTSRNSWESSYVK